MMNVLFSLLFYLAMVATNVHSSLPGAAFNSKLDAIKSHHLGSFVGFPKEIAHLKVAPNARYSGRVNSVTGTGSSVNSDAQNVALSPKHGNLSPGKGTAKKEENAIAFKSLVVVDELKSEKDKIKDIFERSALHVYSKEFSFSDDDLFNLPARSNYASYINQANMDPRIAMLENSSNVTRGFMTISYSISDDFSRPVYQTGYGITCMIGSHVPPVNASADDDYVDDIIPVAYNSLSYFCTPPAENHGVIWGANWYSDSNCSGSVVYSKIFFEFASGYVAPNQNSPYYQLATCQAQNNISTLPLQEGNYAVTLGHYVPPYYNDPCTAINYFSVYEQDQCVIWYQTECICSESSGGGVSACRGYNSCCDFDDDNSNNNSTDDNSNDYWDIYPICRHFPTAVKYGCMEDEGVTSKRYTSSDCTTGVTEKKSYGNSSCLVESKHHNNYTETLSFASYCSSSSNQIHYDDAFDDIDSHRYSPLRDDDDDDDYHGDDYLDLPSYVITYFTDNLNCNVSNPNSYTFSIGYSCSSCFLAFDSEGKILNLSVKFVCSDEQSFSYIVFENSTNCQGNETIHSQNFPSSSLNELSCFPTDGIEPLSYYGSSYFFQVPQSENMYSVNYDALMMQEYDSDNCDSKLKGPSSFVQFATGRCYRASGLGINTSATSSSFTLSCNPEPGNLFSTNPYGVSSFAETYYSSSSGCGQSTNAEVKIFELGCQRSNSTQSEYLSPIINGANSVFQFPDEFSLYHSINYQCMSANFTVQYTELASNIPTSLPSISPTAALKSTKPTMNPTAAAVSVYKIEVFQGLSNVSLSSWNSCASCADVFTQSVASVMDTTMGSEFTDSVQSIVIQQVSSSNSRRNLQSSVHTDSISVLSVAYFINFYSTTSSAAGSFASSVNANLVESVNNGVFTSTVNSIASDQNVSEMTYAFSDTVNTSLVTLSNDDYSGGTSSGIKSLSGAEIAGIAVAALLVFVGTAGLYFYKFHYTEGLIEDKDSRSQKHYISNMNSTNDNPIYQSSISAASLNSRLSGL